MKLFLLFEFFVRASLGLIPLCDYAHKAQTKAAAAAAKAKEKAKELQMKLIREKTD